MDATPEQKQKYYDA
ncbi:hypothetical protein V3C99_008268, partial [Haemonchus contortus]